MEPQPGSGRASRSSALLWQQPFSPRRESSYRLCLHRGWERLVKDFPGLCRGKPFHSHSHAHSTFEARSRRLLGASAFATVRFIQNRVGGTGRSVKDEMQLTISATSSHDVAQDRPLRIIVPSRRFRLALSAKQYSRSRTDGPELIYQARSLCSACVPPLMVPIWITSPRRARCSNAFAAAATQVEPASRRQTERSPPDRRRAHGQSMKRSLAPLNT